MKKPGKNKFARPPKQHKPRGGDKKPARRGKKRDDIGDRPLDRKILETLQTVGAMDMGSLAYALGFQRGREHKILRDALGHLEHEGKIRKDHRGAWRSDVSSRTMEGKLTVTPSGYGFMAPASGGPDVFVPAKHLGAAMDGDRVRVRIVEESDRPEQRGPVGAITEILARDRHALVGSLITGRYGYLLRPLSKRVPRDIRVMEGPHDLRSGLWVEARLLPHDEKGGEAPVCEVLRVIGRVGVLADDIAAVIVEYHLCPPYTEERERAAAELKPREIAREDLTDLVCVTIDPPDAKDFDDAVSVSPGKNPNEIVLGVHIADVAAWIVPGSDWDAMAGERGFTAYIPGNTLPMLPKTLTRSISLTERNVCPAHSVLFRVNAGDGKILDSRRTRSLVRIAARLTFDEVEAFIAGDRDAIKQGETIKAALGRLVPLYRSMRAARGETEKFLDLATTEIRVLRDDATGEIQGIVRKVQGEADKLVEEFMLAANSAVAGELSRRALPGLYRLHPPPDEEKIQEFSAFALDVFGLETGDLLSGREACRHFLEKAAGETFRDILFMAFLRALNRALYAPSPGLHYGLGKGLYAHFTSPIRRYPDLFVHQRLWDLDVKAAAGAEAEDLPSLALACSEKEKNIDEAWYAANDRLKLHYLKSLMDRRELDMYEAVISRVSASGVQADIRELGLMAFVPTENLRGRFHRQRGRLVAERGDTRYMPGHVIYLTLDRVDFIKGVAIFHPA